MPKHPRRHLLFPTVEEVKKDPSLAYSDHLPILVTVPLEQEELKIISLNTLGPNSPHSGLHSDLNWETDEEAKERYARMVAGLVNAKDQHGVDAIFLQETKPDFIVPILKEKLGSEWKIIIDDSASMVTCYSKQRFVEIKTSFINKNRARSLTLQDKFNDNVQIDIHNVWDNYNPFPNKHEIAYRSLLTETDSKVSIIVGDTNSRIAPIDNDCRNIATGVVPVRMNSNNGAEPEVQITDYPDGGFYKDQNNKIYQLNRQILHYSTGDICEDVRTLEELDSWPEYRMVLCFDESFQTNEVIKGKTIFTYENEIKEKLTDNKIIIRMAADSFNRKALGIRFSQRSKAYQFIKQKLGDEEGFQFKMIDSEVDMCGYKCIFAPIEKIGLLDQAIHEYIQTMVVVPPANNVIAVVAAKESISSNEIETIYTTWLRESKIGLIIDQPRMADTKAIDTALVEYHEKVINHASLDDQVNALKKTLPLVNSWIENQNKAIFCRYSDRYSAVMNLKNRLEVAIKVLNEQTLPDFSAKLDATLEKWQKFINKKLEGSKNITGINKMASILNSYNKEGDINDKLNIFYKIKEVAEQRLSGSLVSQLYYKSSLFGKGRNVTGVQVFYEIISQTELDAFCEKAIVPNLQQVRNN